MSIANDNTSTCDFRLHGRISLLRTGKLQARRIRRRHACSAGLEGRDLASSEGAPMGEPPAFATLRANTKLETSAPFMSAYGLNCRSFSL
jgi:hypothetical protein